MRELITIAGLALVISFMACKPTEENYKAAYDKAKEQVDAGGIDSTIYARIRQAARPSRYVIGSDTMPIVTQRVTLTKDQDVDQFRRYNVVVAQFKQIFNARSLRQRLYDAGYPDPFIVETAEPLYFVVAGSCPTPADAMALWKKVSANPPIAMKEPFPYVLQVAQLIR